MVSDVQAKTGVGNVDATAAFGSFSGNDKQSVLGQLNSGLLSGLDSGWSVFGASDDAGNGPFTSTPSGTTGMSFLDADVAPIDGPFVLALKGGPTYSAYLFDGTVSGVTGFIFDTSGIEDGNGSPSPGLSHATLYVNSGPSGGGGGGDQVPEPSTMLTWLCLATVLCVWMLRRKPTSPRWS
jgi:hypothetical protein